MIRYLMLYPDGEIYICDDRNELDTMLAELSSDGLACTFVYELGKRFTVREQRSTTYVLEELSDG